MSRPDYYGNPGGVTEDIDVVRAIYAAFEERDVEGALAWVSADCELDLRGTATLIGRSEPYRGHEGFRQYFVDVAKAWDEITLHAEDFRAIPGSVIVMGHVDARLNGEPIRRNAVWTWRVHEGKATHVRVSDLGSAPRED